MKKVNFSLIVLLALVIGLSYVLSAKAEATTSTMVATTVASQEILTIVSTTPLNDQISSSSVTATGTTSYNPEEEYATTTIAASTGTTTAFIYSGDEQFPQNSSTISVTVEGTSQQNSSSSTNIQVYGAAGQNSVPQTANQTVSTTVVSTTVFETKIKETVDKIISYLKTQQDTDGKIFDGPTSDWLAMSFAAAKTDPAEVKKYSKSLLDFMLSYDVSDGQNSELNLCAGYARHALALYGAGVSPNSESLKKHWTKIKNDCYQDDEYGQKGINDDIFGLLAALKFGPSDDMTMVSKIVQNILNSQDTQNGSFSWGWGPSSDATGAVINVLLHAKSMGIGADIQNATAKAITYLKGKQLDDAGWNDYGTNSDVLTTGWVIMGINSLKQGQEDWKKNNRQPIEVLIDNLTEQGYYQSVWMPPVDWFATKHAIPALLGYSWPIEPYILQNLEQTPPNRGVGGGLTGDLRDTNTSQNRTTTTLDVLADKTTLSTSSIENTTITEELAVKNSPNMEIKPIITKKDAVVAKEIKIVTYKKINDNNSARQDTKKDEHSDQPSKVLPLEQKPNQQVSELASRKTAKTTLVFSGTGALAVGLYLGLKLLKNLL